MRARARFEECIKTEELRCAIVTVESERKVYAMHKKNRIELGRTIMTAERVRKFCRMLKNRTTQFHNSDC